MFYSILRKASDFLRCRNGWTIMGSSIPAKPGQKFDIRLQSGDEMHGLIAGQSTSGATLKGVRFEHCGHTHHTHFVRDFGFFGVSERITHYRLHKPVGITAEDEVRARRENTWRDWANSPNPDAVGGLEEPKRMPEVVQ